MTAIASPHTLARVIVSDPKRVQTHDTDTNPDKYRRLVRKALNRLGFFSPEIILAVVPGTCQIVARKKGMK
jgi:hypothetical protein